MTEETTKRLEKNAVLVKLFLDCYIRAPTDLIPLVLLTCNQIREPWADLTSVLNLGESLVRQTITGAFNTSAASVRKQLDTLGDYGLVAEAFRKRQNYVFVKPKPMSVHSLHQRLCDIADISGADSATQKTNVIKRMYVDASPLEARYITRLVLGKFRLGVQKKSVVAALGDFFHARDIYDASEKLRQRAAEAISHEASHAGAHSPGSSEMDSLLDTIYQRVLESRDSVPAPTDIFPPDNAKQASQALQDRPSGRKSLHPSGQDDGQTGTPSEGSDSDSSEYGNDSDIAGANGDGSDTDNEGSALDSVHSPTSYRQTMGLAYSYCPSLEAILSTVLRAPPATSKQPTASLDNLMRISIRPGIPVLPMLAKATTGPEEILERLQGEQDFLAEYKYDGFRAQIHYDSAAGIRKVFSRSLEDMSKRFPDVLSSAIGAIRKVPPEGESSGTPAEQGSDLIPALSSFIIDGEVVAVDFERAEIRPFQDLSRRLKEASAAPRREAGSNVASTTNPYPIIIFCFDILYANGRSLMALPLRERRKVLRSSFVESAVAAGMGRGQQSLQDSLEPLELQNSPNPQNSLNPVNPANLATPKWDGRGGFCFATGNIYRIGPDTAAPGEHGEQGEHGANSTVIAEATGKQNSSDTEADSPAQSGIVGQLYSSLKQAVAHRTEGLVVKILDGPASHYRPDERSKSWLKLKKDYIDALGDSFDVVPVAAWLGKGKRTGVYGAYLLAAYNANTERWETLTQIGTGFSDEVLKALTIRFQPKAKSTVPSDVFAKPRADPDAWFAPEDSEVWEVRCANLSLSPVHTAAWGEIQAGKGIGLRLPRFLRLREDKKPEDCTTIATITEAFRRQPDREDQEEME